MKEEAFVSVLVYIRNSEDSIKKFLLNLDKFFLQNFKNYEIILLDDFSTDKTMEKINSIKGKLNKQLVVVKMAWPHGNEFTMLAGTELSIGDYIFEIESTTMDCPIETLRRLFDKATEGFDLVAAVPNSGVSFSSRVFYTLLNKLSYLTFDLYTERLRIVSRRALNSALKSREKIRYRKALYKLSGFPSTSIKYSSKLKSKPNRSIRDSVALAVEVLLLFSNLGPNLSFFAAFIFIIISILFGVYVLYVYLTFNSVLSGWTTIMLFLSVGFSGVFFILGLIGKYVSMLMMEIKNRQSYSIESINKI